MSANPFGSAQAFLSLHHYDATHGDPLGPVKFTSGKTPLIHPQNRVSAIRHALNSGETDTWSSKDFTDNAKALASKYLFSDSRRTLKIGTDRFPDNEVIHTQYAISCMQSYEEGVRDFDADAEKHLRIAIGLKPDDVFPLTMLGKLYTNQGRHDLAEDVLVRAAAIDNHDAATFYALGRSYDKAFNKACARACYGYAANILFSDDGRDTSTRLRKLTGDVTRSLRQIEKTTGQKYKPKDLHPIMEKIEGVSEEPQVLQITSQGIRLKPVKFGL